MSVENIIIYFLIPILGWILIRLNRLETKVIARLEKKLIILVVMLRDRGFRLPDKTDTDIFMKSNDL